MSFEQRNEGDVTIVELTPELVTDVSKDLFQLTIDSLLANGRRQLVLDLSGLRWMNSYALGLLVSAHRSFETQGGRVVLSQPNERVKEMLRVVGLAQVWSLYDDEAAAIASFAE